MNCPSCGAWVTPGQQYCQSCGSPVGSPYTPQPYPYTPYMNENSLPPQYRPLGAWAYFGYMLLFSIPLLGFIFLIVYSFSDENINRRNFARSYWCAFLLGLIIFVIILVTGLAAGLASYSRY